MVRLERIAGVVSGIVAVYLDFGRILWIFFAGRVLFGSLFLVITWGCGEFEGWVKGELGAARLAGAILESSTNVVTQHGPTQHNTSQPEHNHHKKNLVSCLGLTL